MEFALNIPLNRTSIGNTSFNIAREIYNRGLKPALFPISEIDLKCFSVDDQFKNWINECISKGLNSHSRKNPVLKIWHIDNTNSYSKNQLLYTFHECDQATPVEINIVNNSEKTLFPCSYNVDVFKTFGAQNVSNVALGFDSYSFKRLDKIYHPPGIISMGLFGKCEFRKNHHKVLNLWAKKFGNKREYVLNCALYNPFMRPEHQQAFINTALEGKKYWNINFLPYMESNYIYNDALNSIDIVLDLSSAESWSLPSFQAVAIGKHAVLMNAHGIKDWANNENSVLVNPSGKRPLYDNIFFKEGNAFNQGSGFDFSDEDFYKGVDSAIGRFNKSPINENGFKLQEEFTYKKMVDNLLSELEIIQ